MDFVLGVRGVKNGKGGSMGFSVQIGVGAEREEFVEFMLLNNLPK
jgi:hypothetical protein